MFIPSDTQTALGNVLPENRSLYFDRFANPNLKEESRQNWFEGGCKLSVPVDAGKRIRDSFYPAGTRLVYGQLKARLMVNMAGGVMENAGLCLDRYGLPYIPGSAVKGCARRAALYALREWTQSGRPEAGDVCHMATDSFESPEVMLHQIALTFGWGETDWSGPDSDFLWALSNNVELLRAVRSRHGIHGISSHAGAVAFFPSHPNADPGLELDILTCHHPEYYGDSEKEFAPDTEEPNPVTFPAVRAQNGDDHFTFALVALRREHSAAIRCAETWLTLGLEVFGLGAKTAAGYGWFEVEETSKRILDRKKNAVIQGIKDEEIRKKDLEVDLRTKVGRLGADGKSRLLDNLQDAKVALETLRNLFPNSDKTPSGHISPKGFNWFADESTKQTIWEVVNVLVPKIREELETNNLSPAELLYRQIAALGKQQFEQKLVDFCDNKSRDEQEAIVRALREQRTEAWAELKEKVANKPKKYTQIADAIRAVSKAMNLGKMP